MNKQKKLILAAAAAGVIATFLPWISVSAGAFGYNVSQSRNGFHGIGILYFLLHVSAGIIALTGDKSSTVQGNMRLAVMGSGIVSAICLFISYSGDSDLPGGGYGVASASIGFGLILAFIATAGLVAIPLAIRQPEESLQHDLASLKNSFQSIQQNMPVAKPSTSIKNPNRMAEMEKLVLWRSEGKISQEEYEEMKAKII